MEREVGERGRIRQELQPGRADAAIAAVAERQHGVVCRRGLSAAGLTEWMIRRRIRCGQLHRIHRGVYAVGHGKLSWEGRRMAAVLSGGPSAVLSHASAGMHWGAIDRYPSLPSITTPTKGLRRPGTECHSAQLAPDEVTVHDGIPITTAARTLLDLAAVLPPDRLERALAQAEFLRLSDVTPLSVLVERHRGARGTKALRRILASGAPTAGITRSALEDRFVTFVDERGLPRPALNQPLQLAGEFIAVDCLWRPQRVALELDGRASHERKAQFATDRRRDRRLLAAGWRPVRVAREQLSDRVEADALERDLRLLLGPR